MEINITKHAFRFGTQSYFRGNAINVKIGSYGEKKDPIGAKSHLDVENEIKPDHLVDIIEVGPAIEFDWNRSNRAEVEVEGLRYHGVTGSAAFQLEDANRMRLRLMPVTLGAAKLRNVLNTKADGARKFLASEGQDARVVSEVWIIVEGKVAQTFGSAGGIAAEADGDNVAIRARGGADGGLRLRLGPGSAFAYKLHKVKDWTRGKEEIEELEADWKGMG